jgi:hypothetical protein
LDKVVEAIPVCVFVAVTVTPGMLACVVSWTNPVIVALLLCDNTIPPQSKVANTSSVAIFNM